MLLMQSSKSEERHQTAAVPLNPACEFKLEQHHPHRPGRCA
jgi:hypothetical protein